MKITVAFCDVHHTYQLSQFQTEVLSKEGKLTFSPSWGCTVPGCNRHFRRDASGYYGHFDEYPQMRDFFSRPCKGHTELPEFMVITKVNGVLIWACLDENCDRTQPLDTLLAEASA